MSRGYPNKRKIPFDIRSRRRVKRSQRIGIGRIPKDIIDYNIFMAEPKRYRL